MTDMIGPLTAAGWAEFRQRADDRDLLQCCAVTSEFRDAVFELLRSADTVYHPNTHQVLPGMVSGFRSAYLDMVDHGLPDGRGGELIDRLARYYLGDPPAPATDLDRMHPDQIQAELCHHSGQPTVGVRPDRFAVCALPEGHPSYRYLALRVELRRVDPDAGSRWSVRWGEFVYVFGADYESGDWEVRAGCPDDEDLAGWRRRREFPLSFALRVAQEQAVKVDVNGRTAADIAARDQAGAER